MNKTLVFVLVIAVVLVGGYFLIGGKDSSQNETESAVNEDNSNIPPLVGEDDQNKAQVQEFIIDASNFKFSLTEIKIKKGETVKITLNNKEGLHDFVIDEFGAKTKQLKVGEQETIEFVADKTGTFEYYCSVGEHRKMGMKGSLIVE